jgi:predicted peptidase
MKRLFPFVSFAAALLLSACATIPAQNLPRGPVAGVVDMPDGSKINYITDIPPAWHGGKAPVIIFLHGSGEAGPDPMTVVGPGPWAYAKAHPDFPFIILAPQQPADIEWDPKRLKIWLDAVEKRVPVDKKRIYLTGLSLGGGGSWDFAMSYPKLFAAVAPVSGYSNLKTPCALKGVPVWAFHGQIDDVVPIAQEEAVVNDAKACGVDVRYTIYPNGNHNAWDATYANPDLYAWFLSHKLQ